VILTEDARKRSISKRTRLRVLHVWQQLEHDVVGKDIGMQNRIHQSAKFCLPFFAMRIDPIAMTQVDTQMGHLVDVRNEEKVGIEFMVQRDTRPHHTSTRCEVTYLCLPRSRYLQFERRIHP